MPRHFCSCARISAAGAPLLSRMAVYDFQSTYGLAPMTNSFKRISLLSLVVATGLAATQAFAQAPTDAQRNATKSSCRSDYIAHCASVQPGGAAALQCLQKNMASLSRTCQAAVKAVTASASEAKPATPAAAESKPATETKAAVETAKPAETRSATRGKSAAPVAAPPSRYQV